MRSERVVKLKRNLRRESCTFISLSFNFLCFFPTELIDPFGGKLQSPSAAFSPQNSFAEFWTGNWRGCSGFLLGVLLSHTRSVPRKERGPKVRAERQSSVSGFQRIPAAYEPKTLRKDSVGTVVNFWQHSGCHIPCFQILKNASMKKLSA